RLGTLRSSCIEKSMTPTPASRRYCRSANMTASDPPLRKKNLFAISTLIGRRSSCSYGIGAPSRVARARYSKKLPPPRSRVHALSRDREDRDGPVNRLQGACPTGHGTEDR